MYHINTGIYIWINNNTFRELYAGDIVEITTTDVVPSRVNRYRIKWNEVDGKWVIHPEYQEINNPTIKLSSRDNDNPLYEILDGYDIKLHKLSEDTNLDEIVKYARPKAMACVKEFLAGRIHKQLLFENTMYHYNSHKGIIPFIIVYREDLGGYMADFGNKKFYPVSEIRLDKIMFNGALKYRKSSITGMMELI